MNHELLREMKEAGFPLKPYFRKGEDTADNEYLVPTLSELIAACGDDFFQLTKGSACWYAEPDIELAENTPQIVQGSSPEEAVSRLWLVLNTK